MGKYSLDAFEVYPLVKLRPAMKTPEADCCRLVELSQSELEPETGELLPPPPVGLGQVILRLHPDDKKDVLDVCGFIRRMGCCYGGGINLAGVVLTSVTLLLRIFRHTGIRFSRMPMLIMQMHSKTI